MAIGFKIDREHLRLLPVGNGGWAEFSQTNYAVDMALPVKAMIDGDTGVALFTRPRPFGKNVEVER